MSGGKVSVRHGMQGVFVFVLLGLFAVMSTLMVLLGAQMYRGTVERSTTNNDERVLSAYVRSMVRAEDSLDSVAIENYGDIHAVALYEDIDGERYVTWLYHYDGKLYEQFTDAGYEFDPAAGTAVCGVKSFEPALENGLLTVEMVSDEDERCEVRVAVRCAG